MRRAYMMRVRPGMEVSYKESHRAVWPELIEAAKLTGIRNHSVFMHGNILLLYLEADAPDEAISALKTYEVKRRWDDYMRSFLEPGSIVLEEVFHMD